jgi:hypothetical protein
MIRYVVLCTKTYFICIKSLAYTRQICKTRQTQQICQIFVTLDKLAFASTLFLSYLPNSPCTSTYFFDILAKLDSREYIFLTYLPNSTRASHNINTKCAADPYASTCASTCDICQTCSRKIPHASCHSLSQVQYQKTYFLLQYPNNNNLQNPFSIERS